jgi:hypothetical protein
MYKYSFKSQGINTDTVKSIITKAGYSTNGLTYDTGQADMVKVTSDNEMDLVKLRTAVTKLGLNVGITGGKVALLADATEYQVNITMSSNTVQQLLANNFYLYGFKAVQCTIGGGSPVVWFKTQNYSASTEVLWEEQYQAYTSNSQIIPNGQVIASFAADISLGQTLNVGPGGVGTVVSGGPSTAISLANTTSNPFTCGISQVQNGTANPLCAFPLFGNDLDVIAPIEKVLLMFSTNPVNTGTVIEQSYGPGILIDLTSDNLRNVNYDLNAGWSWGGFSWAQSVTADSNLVPLLIETPSAAFKHRALVFATAP